MRSEYYDLVVVGVRKASGNIEGSCSGLLASKELLAQALRIEMLKSRICFENAALKYDIARRC